MNVFKFFIGLCLGLVLILAPIRQFQPDAMDNIQTIAVQIEGRKKPLDTVAKETLAKIHGTTAYQGKDGKIEGYLDTYLSLWVNSRNWNEEPIILVNYRPLKEAIGVDLTQKYFTFQDLMANPSLINLLQIAHVKQEQDETLTRLQKEALILEDRLELLFASVGNTHLPIIPHPSEIKGKWVGLDEAATLYEPATIGPLLAQYGLLQQVLFQGAITGDVHQGNGVDEQTSLALTRQGETSQGETSQTEFSHSQFSHSDVNHREALGALSEQFKQSLHNLSPQIYPPHSVLAREVHFNHFHPFAKAWMIYIVAFIGIIGSSFIKTGTLYWGAMGVFAAGIGVQAYGFFLRMQIAGRPPVTNMYESVVWVGFGIAAIAFIFELLTRSRYYLLAAAPLSVACLLLADSLPAVLDPSISPLVPVLRDNFWLSIHVPTIALSYASFALAMGLGHVALGTKLFMPNAKERFRTLSQFNYRVLQVGILLLTSGIILGGIWAHFSWGRFWGWDPKETWALIALLCYLAPLHGRLVGWIGNFGINVASIISFNAVLMAWYGVNFVLGTGLHSYGFGTGGSELLIGGVVGLDLLFVLVVASRQYGWLKHDDIEPELSKG